MSQATKEPSFFCSEINWSKGMQWYETLFPEQAKVIGESSTNYTKYPAFQGVSAKMHEIIPNAKLIYLVRDPVDQSVENPVMSETTRLALIACLHQDVDEFREFTGQEFKSWSL